MSGRGNKRGGGQGAPPEAAEAIREQMAALTPEQQQALRAAAANDLLRRRRVQHKGKTMSLSRLSRIAAEKQRLFESGAFDETVRSVPRWELQEATPARSIRQGAYKQQLRQYEEAELELDRFGQGVVTSVQPLFAKLASNPVVTKLFETRRRDFAWGMYARTGNAEQVLSKAWPGRDPQAALASAGLYEDAVRYAHQMELTLVALTSRPLPLADTRQALAAKLESSMRRLSGAAQLAPQDRTDLSAFISKFDDVRVAAAGWMDGKGNVREGTHFLFSTTPEGKLLAEAITPGPLAERRTSRIGVNANRLLTASVFDLFLGPDPLDAHGKSSVGHGLLWAANGLRFRPWELTEGSHVAQHTRDGRLAFPAPDPERVEVAPLPLRPSMFQLLDSSTQPLRRTLLGGLHGDA